ncbi:MAG: hypothetical protein ACXVK4_03660 [Acidimicrobiia bacterium]
MVAPDARHRSRRCAVGGESLVLLLGDEPLPAEGTHPAQVATRLEIVMVVAAAAEVLD